MSVTIKYKGNTIASANTDTTKTIKTSGKYCEADIVVENVQDGGITPTGNINITDTNVTDVTNYATATVVDADLVAENIKKDVNILGVVGSFEGGGAEITDGIVVKARDANGYATEVDYYVGNVCFPDVFYQGYRPSSWNFDINTSGVWKSLQTINVIGKPTRLMKASFGYNPANIVADFSDVTVVDGSKNNVDSDSKTFFNCIGLTDISFPKLSYLLGGMFAGCTALKTVSCPKCQTVYSPWNATTTSACFGGCTALENVELGSIGTQCLLINGKVFSGCTNANLVITLFCNGSNADAQLSYIRTGATNATIIIKASENTTYNGTAYNAGDTMITSEVA